VLRHGDYTLYESVAILTYIDRRFPEVPLFGRTPEETGLVWRATSEFFAYVEPPLLDGVVRPIFRGAPADAHAGIDARIKEVHAELEGYDKKLAAGAWLVGDALSAADIVLFPAVMGLLRAATRPAAETLNLGVLPLEERYPALGAWRARIEALPGYDETYPPHWR
jgi:glutathione S-transferase